VTTTINLSELSAGALAASIARGDLSAVEAVEASIARIEAVNPRLNAVVIDADGQTGRATDIERLSYGLEELKDLGIGSVRSTV